MLLNIYKRFYKHLHLQVVIWLVFQTYISYLIISLLSNSIFFFCISEVEFQYPDADRKRPDVPKKDDQPLMGLKTTKNFITTNAVQNITSVPKRPEKIYVDTKKGDKNYLEPSGLEPVYLHKKVIVKENAVRITICQG